MAPPGCEKVHHKLYRNPGTADDRFSHQNLRINYNTAVPVHEDLSNGRKT